MTDNHDIGLMAHLMRRAGFGAPRHELESRAAKGYDATVDELIEASTDPADEHVLLRYQPAALLPGGNPPMGNVHWMFHLVNTQRPLEEKMALFWHHVFATGNSKVDNYDQLLAQIAMFRQRGMGNYRELLVALAKDPAMIYWLDNNENHKDAVNENWGRELLELFSMGQGNYTEKDVREASRAFTGWTFSVKIPRLPYGRFPWEFEYVAEDHDDTEKEFLGHTGNFNGEDVIDIIVRQPACGRFIARHLYNFFVADEPQALLQGEEPGGTGRGYPAHGWRRRDTASRLWARRCHAADLHGPGSAQSTERRGLAHRQGMDQQRFLDEPHQLCCGHGRQHRAARGSGPLQVGTDTRQELLQQAREGGPLTWDSDDEAQASTGRIGEMLQLIVAMREYQFN